MISAFLEEKKKDLAWVSFSTFPADVPFFWRQHLNFPSGIHPSLDLTSMWIMWASPQVAAQAWPVGPQSGTFLRRVSLQSAEVKSDVIRDHHLEPEDDANTEESREM